MAKKTKSDISNSALRIFLQDVGKFYDEAKGFEEFVPKKGQKEELLKYFDFQCCFCGCQINIKSLSQDHLVPMNKKSLGLHSWGNIVPCCQDCNNKKKQKHWKDFLKDKCSSNLILRKRKKKISDFVKIKQYDPNVDLHELADNLYEDIGEVAMTLIKLRYNQAEDRIKKLLNKSG